MKNGIQIEIQKDLSSAETKEAKEFANGFLKGYLADGLRVLGTGGGWASWFRRGTAGMRINRSDLYIRRASKHRRIYQIVKSETINIATKDGMAITKDNSHMYHYNDKTKESKKLTDRCMCPKCSGQLKVTNKYTPMPIYATIGDIKG